MSSRQAGRQAEAWHPESINMIIERMPPCEKQVVEATPRPPLLTVLQWQPSKRKYSGSMNQFR